MGHTEPASNHLPVGSEVHDGELSDAEIQRLLKQAEVELRAAIENRADAVDTGKTTHISDVLEARKPLPKLKRGLEVTPYIQEKNGIAHANTTILVAPEQRKLAEQLRMVEDAQKSKKTNDQLSAGPEWFDLPKTVLDPQLKRDLQLIEMRSVLDPHRHYKKDNRHGKAPTFSQVGTVIEGPTEWYSSRINKKDRSKNFVEETMNTEKQTGRFKRKYGEIQATKTSGKKAHYKALMTKRKKKL